MGDGRDWHAQRAQELARILEESQVPCDFRVSADERTVHGLGYLAMREGVDNKALN
ncbi:MAG: hypothetical protein GKR90_23960 [Pseudomonadales bacterium]|nr:hypothetical protein [Pseudomonadales bacterium]